MKLPRLSYGEIRAGAQSLYWLFRVKKRMNSGDFQELLFWAKKKVSQQTKPSVKALELSRLCRILESAADHLTPDFNCLPRAIAGFIICRREGYQVNIRIGTRRVHPMAPFEAHAWIEHNSRVILGELPGMEYFTPFPSLDGPVS